MGEEKKKDEFGVLMVGYEADLCVDEKDDDDELFITNNSFKKSCTINRADDGSGSK